MNAFDMLLYCISTVGMCHIIVDGSILQWFRNMVKGLSDALHVPHLGNIVDCYLCCGTWCGFLMGWVWVVSPMDTLTPLLAALKVFGCGCAGGFLSNAAAVWLNYMEANTLVSMPPDQAVHVPQDQDQDAG